MAARNQKQARGRHDVLDQKHSGLDCCQSDLVQPLRGRLALRASQGLEHPRIVAAFAPPQGRDGKVGVAAGGLKRVVVNDGPEDARAQRDQFALRGIVWRAQAIEVVVLCLQDRPNRLKPGYAFEKL